MFAAKLLPNMPYELCKIARCLLAAVLILPIAATAQDTDIDLRRLPWDIFAETMQTDGKTRTTTYTGLQFSQGNISISADEGRATFGEQDSGFWQFIGNVIFKIDTGKIECDSAQLQFDGNVLSTATVEGQPASFEIIRAGGTDVTKAKANLLNYDVRKGIIEFSGGAVITEAGNEISASSLTYNIIDRRINADSSDTDEDRVRVIYTPTDEELDGLAQDAEEEVDSP
jgi:lipopolysaccharide export system protein LptA